jgi:hypothetical protein
MFKNRQRGLVVLAAVALFGVVSAPAAYAGANVTWTSICSGYSGKSFYTASNGMGYAITTAGDSDQVGAAIRYSSGSTAYTKGNGYAERSRAAALYGGYHQSYCGLTVTKSSTA